MVRTAGAGMHNVRSPAPSQQHIAAASPNDSNCAAVLTWCVKYAPAIFITRPPLATLQPKAHSYLIRLIIIYLFICRFSSAEANRAQS